MGMFSKLSEVKISKYEKLYFDPNEYIIEIIECKKISSDNGDFLIVSGKILAKKTANGPELGETASWVQGMNGLPDIWKRALMEFLCGVLVAEVDDYTDEEWENAVADIFENDGLKNEITILKTVHKETKKGTDFTKHIWKGPPSESDWNKYEFVLNH